MTSIRYTVFLFFIFLFFPAPAVLKAQGNEKKPDEISLVETIFRNGDILIDSKDYNGARKEYAKIRDMKQVSHAAEMVLFSIAKSYRLEKNYAAAHKTYGEIFNIPGLTPNYRIYGLFLEADLYMEQGDYESARRLYSEIKEIKRAPDNKRRLKPAATNLLNTGSRTLQGAHKHHIFMAELYTGDTYRKERRYRQARGIYERLLRQQDSSVYPNENFRLEVSDRLEALEGMKDGQEEKSIREKRAEWVNRPKQVIYVSLNGNDGNPGTEEEPFATIKRAQEEVRRIKAVGIPEGGIAVYLRGGKYFLEESIKFKKDDSGRTGSPVVYRSYPGEEVRLIGGKQLSNFKLLDEPDILRRLPEESRGKVWVCNLKEEGIDDYGHLRNRGTSYSGIDTAAMELFYNTMPMNLSRWPDEGWERVFDLVTPRGDGKVSDYFFQKGRFRYSGDRPGRWKEEKEIWAAGYFMWPWDKVHTQVTEIDAAENIVYLSPDMRWWPGYGLYPMPVVKDTPYYFYNILGELSKPGEFYIDRESGKLYFYPPGEIDGSEVMVSTLDAPIIEMKQVSDFLLFGLALECTWHSGITLEECKNSMVAGCVIRNTGNLGVISEGGFNNAIVGCDIYDTGEGGILLDGGELRKLIPGQNIVENNHIYRFNRFSHGGGKYGITLSGVGNRVSHNLMHDSSYTAIFFSGNNQVIEYNEIFDVMNEGRDGGAIYTHCGAKYLMNRGNVMRHNFIHNITEHSSPLKTHQVTGLYVDSLNGAMTMEGNIFYRCTERALFTHGPDTRIADNIFVDCRAGITQSNRTYLLREESRVKLWKDNTLDTIRHRLPPWSARYPQVGGILGGKPYGEPVNVVIERNILSGTPPAKISGDFIYESNSVEENLEDRDAYFIDRGKMDFRLVPGSPVYGKTSFEPMCFEDIGVYKDFLRASWPVKRSPAGKYYKAGWKAPAEDVSAKFPQLKRVSREKEYRVEKRRNPVKIDGVLNKDEWFGLDREKAMVIEEEHITGAKNETSVSHAWVTYDKENIYIGMEHMPDTWKEGMSKGAPVIVHEFAIEGAINQDTWWWQEGVPTGPLHVFTGRPDGRFIVHNLFNMPSEVIIKLQKQVEYGAAMIDKETCHWTAEWKIPLALLNVNPDNSNTVRFNIGGPKRTGWFAWVATGSAIWRVDNAGIITFAR